MSAGGRSSESGSYVYVRDGAVLPVVEQWRVTATGPTTSEVWSQRRSPSGVEMTVTAQVTGGLADSCAIEWRHSSDGAGTHRIATYALKADGLVVSIDGASASMEVAADAILFPLVRVLQGGVIAAVGDGGERDVVIPFIAEPGDVTRLLTPTIERRCARVLELGPNGIDTYAYEGSVYDDRATFWIDRKTRRMIRYRFPQVSQGSVGDGASSVSPESWWDVSVHVDPAP